MRWSAAEVVFGSLLVAPTALWVATVGVAPGPTVGRVAILFAMVGFTAFAEDLVLVARLGVLERAFGGLDRLYRFHRRMAVVTVATLLVHAGLVIVGLLTGQEPPVGRTKIAIGAAALTVLALGVGASFYVHVRHETFIRIQRALGVAFALGAVHALALRGPLVIGFALRAYLVILAALGAAAFVYRSIAGRLAVPRVRYRVDEVDRLDGSVAAITLSPLRSPLRFRPGQFAFLSIVGEDVSREAHPYSIASAPGASTLRFMVKALGDYTETLQELRPGSDALVEGPFGAFWSTGLANPRQVWIAGGVGIAPFLAMAASLDEHLREIDLYYCTEGPEHAHLIDELFEIADRDPRLRVVPVRKRSLGHLTADDIEGASRDIAGKDIFICGPPVMMRNLERQFVSFGVPKGQIHFEDFSFL